MKKIKLLLLLVALFLVSHEGFSQCADSLNIYSFFYEGHTYEIVKENKTWEDASACAVLRNGYLAEINDSMEHYTIFNELSNNAGITTDNTENQFGTASVWIGGSDAGVEGDWIWDGDNDGVGAQFWSGAANGSAVGGNYTIWGTSPAEPDNSGGQDHLTIIIKPTAINFGLWNDLISSNSLYYVIESDIVISAVEDLGSKEEISVYPNPFKDYISIGSKNAESIDRITIYNLMGQEVLTVKPIDSNINNVNVSSLVEGMYILSAHFDNGKIVSQRIVK